MRCGIENDKTSDLKDFPGYFNEKEERIIFDSNLKGKILISDSLVFKDIKTDLDNELSVGLYKLIFKIEGEQNTQHFTDIAKGILIDSEIKDVYFHKVDVIPINGKTVVTAIFEILVNPIPVIFIIYALGGIGISLTGAFTVTKISKLIKSISGNIIKIGASVIVILLGIKVISKW